MKPLDIFYFYKSFGYKIIPLFYEAKAPIFKNWNADYDFDLIEIFLKNNIKPINFGILLGDIVDVEGDSEEANLILDNYFKKIAHPIYKSSKSKHHLFRNSNTNLTRMAAEGIEIRAHRHQSVLPPSTHKDGSKYKWLTDIYKIDQIPMMPSVIEDKIKDLKNKNLRKKYENKIKPGHMRVHCACCAKQFFIHKKRFELELAAVKEMKERWSCHDCRQVDLRDAVRIKRRLIEVTNRNKHSYPD